MTELEKEILFTLNLFTNNFDRTDKSDNRASKRMRDELASFGEQIAVKALKRYRLTTKSNFLNYAEIVNCVKKEVQIKEGLSDSKTAWGKLQEALKISGSDIPEMSQVMKQTIDALGGWFHLRISGDKMSDRSNFYRIYDQYLDEHLTEKLL